MLIGSSVVVAANFAKGLNAYDAGDYKTALAEWTPLAEQGDAVKSRIYNGLHEDAAKACEDAVDGFLREKH